MKHFSLSEYQKDLLLLMITPLSMLITGLAIAWLQLGSRMAELLKLSPFQLVMGGFFCLITGLIGGDLELRLSRYVQCYEPVSRPEPGQLTHRWALMMSPFIVIVPCLLLSVLLYLGGDKGSLVQSAKIFVLAGLQFLVMFGTMFVFASVRRLTVKRNP